MPKRNVSKKNEKKKLAKIDSSFEEVLLPSEKRKPVKEILQEYEVKKKAITADFTKNLNEGLEDPQFYGKPGTVRDICKYLHGNKAGIFPSSRPSDKIEFGPLILLVLVGSALIISIGAIV